MWSISWLCISFSITFPGVGRSYIGLYVLTNCISPFLGIGVTVAFFHALGNLQVAIEVLSRWVNSVLSLLRLILAIDALIPSIPDDLVVFNALTWLKTSVSVKSLIKYLSSRYSISVSMGPGVATWLAVFVPSPLEINFPTFIKNSFIYCAVASDAIWTRYL